MVPPDSQPSHRGTDFRTTHWSVVLHAGDDRSPDQADALERLCRTYWPAVYAFIRRGRDEHDAKDLTQAFFERILAKDWIREADASRGKFRTFLLTSVTHFLANEWDKTQRQKRGGGAVFVSLDDESTEESYILSGESTSPEKSFDHRWAEKVLETVFDRLRQDFARAGNVERFDALKGFLVEGEGSTSYAEVAAQLGMAEVGVRSAVSRLRQRFRELMRDEIAQTVTRPEAVDEEIRYLFEALSAC